MLHGVPAAVVDASHSAFVYALQYGLRLGSAVALLGALVAWTLVGRLPAAASAPAPESPAGHLPADASAPAPVSASAQAPSRAHADTVNV